MKKFPNSRTFSLLTSLFIFSHSSAALAEQFVYEVHCEPTEIEDITRVIQGNIYLALRADKTVKNTNVSVRIRKTTPVKTYKSESDLLKGTGYSFNPSDLSISLGGEVEGHACYADANLLFSINVTRKDGTSQSNEVVIPVKAPGSLATSGKFVIP